MSAHDARLAPGALLALVTCALVVGGHAPWRALVAGLVGAATVSAWAAWRLRSASSTLAGRARHVAVAVAFACALAAVLAAGAGVRDEARASGPLGLALDRGAQVEVTGAVTQEARPAPADRFTGQPRWEASIDAASIDGQTTRALVRVVVSEPQGLVLGSRVALRGALSPSVSARDAAVMWDATVVAAKPGGGVTGLVRDARAALTALVEPLPPRLRGLTAGMVTGDDSAMPPDQELQMRRSGLAHLTAVSGAHFAVLTIVAIWAVRRPGVPRWTQAAVVACVAGAFTFLVGPEASVLRALTMAWVMALALVLGRRARALAALSSGVIALLALDPWVATSLGFCLSVTAVAAIAVWAPHIAARLERWLVPRLARLVAIPLAASAATAPILVSVSGGIGLYAVPANLIAAPFAPLVTILGLAALIVEPAAPLAAGALIELAGACARPVDLAAKAFATAPGAWIDWPSGALGVAALAAVVALAVAATLARRVRGWGLASALLACTCALFAPVVLTVASAPKLPDWDVIACDVGQGDMLLLRTGDRSAVVIDTGPPGGGADACLARHGIGRIELLIVTHPDSDHDGGVDALLASVPIERAWVSPVAARAGSTAALRRAGVPVEGASAGARADIGAVSVVVVAPAPGSHPASDNDASIVVLATAGGASVLALGDLEREGQDALARALGNGVVVDVLKVAHHGSANQSERLVGLLRARVGIIGVGADNPYGHPAPAALDLYGPQVTTLLRTDLCGDILVAVGNGVRTASRCPEDMAG